MDVHTLLYWLPAQLRKHGEADPLPLRQLWCPTHAEMDLDEIKLWLLSVYTPS